MPRLLLRYASPFPLWLAGTVTMAALGNAACGRFGIELYEPEEDAGQTRSEPPAPDGLDDPDSDADDAALVEDPDADVVEDPDAGILIADETDANTEPLMDAADATDAGVRAEAGADASDVIDAAADAAIQNDAALPVARAASLVACGTYHSCGVFSSQLYCWGDNAGSALGSTASASTSSPQAVETAISDWAQVESGQSFACARTGGGDVWCWGTNNAGQLGVGDTTTRSTPVQVPLPAAARFIAAYFQAACALLADESLWCWGDNYEGQMGQSDTFPGSNEPDPLRVPGTWSSVAVGQGHHCALRAPGELWCMGRNSEDELGLGPSAAIQLRTPTRVGSANDWSQISAGQQYTCGMRSDGSLWCWGDNVAGMLGVGDQTARDVPSQVGTGQDWLTVRAHTFHTCGLRAPGTLWCWGRNVEGQLGMGDDVRRVEPAQVGTATDWVDLALGRFHTCARRSDGSLWCAGQNAEGRLGTGDQTQYPSLTPVSAP